MMLPASFKPSPWDSSVFGVDTYEIKELSREVLIAAACTPGHYTVRVDPLASKKLLHEYGFYYCDTLIEPYCNVDRFFASDDAAVRITREVSLAPLLMICHGAFSHGRFHRDFNISRVMADSRYDNWLTHLHGAGKVYGIMYNHELAGFIATEGNRLVLHAIAEQFRGQGLAKFMWSPVCRALFNQRCVEVVSSVSAANLAIVNLYASLGFRFRNPVDLYHRLSQ
jgi:RimJ/RimL family protein N-acetyltransferase